MEPKIKNKKITKNKRIIPNEEVETKKTSKTKTKNIVEKEKIEKTPKKKINNKKKTKLNSKRIFYILILAIDIIITIYFARRNIANYININGEKTKYIGETKNLIFGRNYIVLLTSFFFASYNCLTNKILFNQKNTKKSIIITFIFYLVLNIILFLIFTKRVY